MKFWLLNQAIQKAKHLNIPEVTWRLYREQGHALEEDDQNDKALDSYASAIQIVEAMRVTSSRLK